MRTQNPERVVAAAAAWIGTPYRHQGSRLGVGCDCLGLLRGVWRELLGAEPELTGSYQADWAEAGGDRLLDAARRHMVERAGPPGAGDVILFRWRPHFAAKHAGVAIDPHRFIHAYQGSEVTISALVPQWRRRIAGVFAFPNPTMDE